MSTYEVLARRVGTEVAQLLVDPGERTKAALEATTRGVENRGEGAFVPLVAASGTGKTTLANNLTAFLPRDYGPTGVHRGEVSVEALSETAESAGVLPATRLIPINVDDREAVPPSEVELAAIKRFLRSEIGSRVVILWPETSTTAAEQMARRWRELAGEPPIAPPLAVEGPSRDTWTQTAVSTLALSNESVQNLELLGIDPRTYDPDAFPSLGEFLRAISDAFSRYVQELIEATRQPIALYVVFASASLGEGILSQLTTPGRFGFVDASAVLEASGGSQIGRWWSERRGLLTQALVRLAARVLCLPPTASIPALRRHGPDDVKALLKDLDIEDRGDVRAAQTFGRTDLGRLMRGEPRAATEARGRPSTQAEPAFGLLATEHGFGGGRDKPLNRAVAQVLESYLRGQEVEFDEVTCESRLPDLPLIPDIGIRSADVVTCIEPTWRGSDFLISTNRGTIARYVLTKVRNYCDALGWT